VKVWYDSVVSQGHEDVRLVEAALLGGRVERRQLAARLLDAIQREVAISLLRPAARHGRDPRQEVQDLVQGALIALFENDARELRRWDPDRGRSLESFVRLVARRRVSRLLSQRRGNPWGDEAMEYRERHSDDFARRLEHRARLGEILEVLHARMSPRDAELFDLLFVQGLEPAEVAEQLSMSRGAVNAWSYRTRKQAKDVAHRLAQGKGGHEDGR